MKTRLLHSTIVFLAATLALHAGSRSSANYTVATDSLDAAGQLTSGGLYSHDGSMGGISGVATVAAPAEVAKSGYIGQLYEVTGLEVTGASATVDETATLQLGAAQVLDDDSKITVDASSVSWAVDSGPLTGVDSSGLATADVVALDTLAAAEGSYLGVSDTYGLTVLDTIFDNYGSYASDGLGDDWQVQYFGYGNADAAPGKDPDGDSQNNQFEYTAGLIPTNASSVFTIQMMPVSGQPKIVFDPIVSGRSYTVKSREFLDSGTWLPLAASTTSNNFTERTVADTSVSADTQFYIVDIVRD